MGKSPTAARPNSRFHRDWRHRRERTHNGAPGTDEKTGTIYPPGPGVSRGPGKVQGEKSKKRSRDFENSSNLTPPPHRFITWKRTPNVSKKKKSSTVSTTPVTEKSSIWLRYYPRTRLLSPRSRSHPPDEKTYFTLAEL